MTEPNAATQQAGEKQAILARLEQGRERFLHAFDSVSERDAAWSSSAECWSIAQCAEHVAIAEEQMLRLWEKRAEPGSSPRTVDERLAVSVHDRSHPQQAPAVSTPNGRFGTLQEALAHFRTARQRTLDTVAAMPEADLRGKIVNHPLAGVLDGYQLFTLMAMHPERHGLQVQEICGDPAFPGCTHP